MSNEDTKNLFNEIELYFTKNIKYITDNINDESIIELDTNFIEVLEFTSHHICNSMNKNIYIPELFSYNLLTIIFKYESGIQKRIYNMHRRMVEDRGHMGYDDEIPESIINNDNVSNIMHYYIKIYDGPSPKITHLFWKN